MTLIPALYLLLNPPLRILSNSLVPLRIKEGREAGREGRWRQVEYTIMLHLRGHWLIRFLPDIKRSCKFGIGLSGLTGRLRRLENTSWRLG